MKLFKCFQEIAEKCTYKISEPNFKVWIDNCSIILVSGFSLNSFQDRTQIMQIKGRSLSHAHLARITNMLLFSVEHMNFMTSCTIYSTLRFMRKLGSLCMSRTLPEIHRERQKKKKRITHTRLMVLLNFFIGHLNKSVISSSFKNFTSMEQNAKHQAAADISLTALQLFPECHRKRYNSRRIFIIHL